MRRIIQAGTVASTAVLLGGLALAAPASAAPAAAQTVTATYDCGSYGVTDLKIEASAEGGVGSVKVSTSGGLAPADIPADSVTATLRLERASGGTVDFTGTANEAAPAGEPLTVGPLTAPVTEGDSLDSYIPADGSDVASLDLEILGQANTCKAVSKQTPGPIVF